MTDVATPMTRDQRVATIARCCHEANRAYCTAHGDYSQQEWGLAEEWQQESAISGVEAALNGLSPEQLHEAWCDEKARDGWTYGATKDPHVKTHPCLVPYDQLPEFQKSKDHLFHAIVASLAPRLLIGPSS